MLVLVLVLVHNSCSVHAMRRMAAPIMLAAACSAGPDDAGVLTFSGSVLGAEGDIVRAQLARFEQENPGIRVELRVTDRKSVV